MNVGATLAAALNLTGLSCGNHRIIYIYNIVGASIARPAVICNEFAESQCEFAGCYRADEQCSPLHLKSNIYAAIGQHRNRYAAGDRKGRPYG